MPEVLSEEVGIISAYLSSSFHDKLLRECLDGSWVMTLPHDMPRAGTARAPNLTVASMQACTRSTLCWRVIGQLFAAGSGITKTFA